MSTTKTARVMTIVTLIGAAFLLAGFQLLGPGDTGAEAATRSAEQTPVLRAKAQADLTPSTLLEVQTREIEGFDTPMLTVGEGFTVYRSEADSADPPTSACTGGCAETWPAVVVSTDPDADPASLLDRIEVTGIDASALGLLWRDDLGWQLTVLDWPVYLFADDAAPGDTNGHCVNGFTALTETGKPAMAITEW